MSFRAVCCCVRHPSPLSSVYLKSCVILAAIPRHSGSALRFGDNEDLRRREGGRRRGGGPRVRSVTPPTYGSDQWRRLTGPGLTNHTQAAVASASNKSLRTRTRAGMQGGGVREREDVRRERASAKSRGKGT